MIDLTRALRYPFEGPNAFVKSVIGMLLAMVAPVLFVTGFMLLGYQVRIIQDVLIRRDDELPEYTDFGGDFVRGVQVFFGTLLYYLPSFILAGLGGWLISSAISGFDWFDIIVYHRYPALDQSQVGMIVLCFTLALLWLIFSAPLVMAAVARFAETGSFAVFFDVLNLADLVWDHKQVASSLMWNLFLLAILTQVANVVVSAVVCFAGAYFNFIYLVVAAHLNGQWAVYLRAQRKPGL